MSAVTMTREDIEALMQRRIDAMNARDVPALIALHSEDCVVESPMGGRSTGHDAIRRVYEAWVLAFADAVYTRDQIIVDGNRVAYAMSIDGTHSGDLMGLPPSGKRFTLPIVLLATVGDGVIVHERRYYDYTGLLVQLGVLKAKPA